MKNQLAVIFWFLLITITCSDENKGFVIEGTTIGFNEYQILYLDDLYHQETVDSAKIIDGKFEFSGQLKEPSNYMLRTKNYSDMVMLWLENSDITIELTKEKPGMIKITGSENLAKVNEFQKGVRQLNQTLLSYKNCKITRKDSVTQQKFQAEKESVHHQIDKHYLQYIQQNPDDYYSAFLLSCIIDRIGKNQAAQVYNNFTPEVMNSNYGTYIYRYITYNNELKVGSKAKNFGMKNSKGDMIYLNDYRGEWLLLSFWIAGNGQQTQYFNCDGCYYMNQTLKDYYEKYHSKGLNILSVSLDRNRDAWLKGIRRDSLNWTNVCDFEGFHGVVPLTYNIKSVPTILLLGPDMYVMEKEPQKIAELLERLY